MRHLILTSLLLLTSCLPIPAPAQTIDVAFSPEAGAEQLVVAAIRSAHHSVHGAIYQLTDRNIAAAILYAHSQGLDVELVVDKSQRTERSSLVPHLIQAGIPVRFDEQVAIMHDKVAFVDGQSVLTGSFNWTNAAEHRNAENVLLIHDPDLASTFERNWQSLWGVSVP